MSTEQVSEAGGVSIPHEVIAADMRADFGFAAPIVLTDVGPVKTLTIPVKPGVIVLRGANDCGKSLSLDAVSKLAGGGGTVTRRDQAAAGSVEGLGVRISVRQSARLSGELECLSLEGRLSIGDLVDPRIKDPAAADRHRIKALLQLTGATADAELFRSIMPDAAMFDRIVTADVLKCDDLVEMAAKLKRNLEAESRRLAEQAEKSDVMAVACKAATEGLDIKAETDQDILQAALEDAIYEQGQLAAKAKAAKEARQRGEQAAAQLAEMEDRERVSVDQAAANLAEWKIIAVKCADAVTAAEKALVDAKAQRRECDLQEQAATQKLLQARRESELLDGWKQAVAAAKSAEVPKLDALQAADQAVKDARQGLERGVVVRAAVTKAHESQQHQEAAKAARKQSEQLRDAARGTDDVLSQAVASESLTVKSGRLVTRHPSRGEVYFGERSMGTRWKLAIDEAIKRIRQLGAQQTAIIPAPQDAWSELDPTNKAAIDQYAKSKGVSIITAEATDGGIRAEAFAQ